MPRGRPKGSKDKTPRVRRTKEQLQGKADVTTPAVVPAQVPTEKETPTNV